MGIEVLAGASLAGSVGSGILGAFGANAKAEGEAASYNYKAQVASNNAVLAKQNADQAIAAGGVAAQTNDLKTKNLVSTQLVTQAANGLDVNSGSNVNLRESAESLGHLDTLTILNNALKNSRSAKIQAMNFEAEAGLNKASAENAETAGTLNIMTSLLGGATGVADKWSGYKSKGVV